METAKEITPAQKGQRTKKVKNLQQKFTDDFGVFHVLMIQRLDICLGDKPLAPFDDISNEDILHLIDTMDDALFHQKIATQRDLTLKEFSALEECEEKTALHLEMETHYAALAQDLTVLWTQALRDLITRQEKKSNNGGQDHAISQSEQTSNNAKNEQSLSKTLPRNAQEIFSKKQAGKTEPNFIGTLRVSSTSRHGFYRIGRKFHHEKSKEGTAELHMLAKGEENTTGRDDVITFEEGERLNRTPYLVVDVEVKD